MGTGQYVNDTRKSMKELSKILEGILDSDFDIKLTYGDLYGFVPDFGIGAPIDFNGYAWDHTGFWKQYGNIENSWTERTRKFSAVRIKHLKSDIRHGFAMYILMQPMGAPMDQKAINDYCRQMEEWCDKSKITLEVQVKKTRNGFEFDMWNTRILDSDKGHMGKFVIKRKDMSEGLLNTDFDIKDTDISINSVYGLNPKMWQVTPAMSAYVFQKATKAFFNSAPKTPKHVVDSHYDNRNICRYFIDWIASQPAGGLNDDQFTANDPLLISAFNEWVDDEKFTLQMVKMNKTKDIYFNYDDVKILRIRFE